MGLGWGVGYHLFFSKLDSQLINLKTKIFFGGLFFFSWLGAKTLFYLTAPFDLTLIKNISFWTGGGFVFYGGFIGGALYILIFKSINKEYTWEKIWPILPGLVVGHAIGRMGCFLAGCCFGHPTDLFWGVFINQEYRHPTQLIEAIFLFLIGYKLLKSTTEKRILFSYYLISYGTLRVLTELLRGDEIRGQWWGISPSTWVSVVLVAIGTSVFFRIKSRVYS